MMENTTYSAKDTKSFRLWRSRGALNFTSFGPVVVFSSITGLALNHNFNIARELR